MHCTEKLKKKQVYSVSDLELKGKVNKTNYFPEHKHVIYERNIFHLAYIGEEHAKWEHRVDGGGKDDGMTFCHRWVSVNESTRTRCQSRPGN